MWSLFKKKNTEITKIYSSGELDPLVTTCIKTPDGREYMTVTKQKDQVKFLNFGTRRVTIQFDIKALDYIIDALIKIRDHQ